MDDHDTADAWAHLGPLPEHELEFHFLSGTPSLEFATTVGERWRRNFERLRTPDDFSRWAVESGLLASPPQVSSGQLDAARELREAIYRTAKLAGEGKPDPADVALMNRWAAKPPLAPTLDDSGRRLALRGSTDALLSTLARDAIELVTGPHAHRVRECASDTCALIFVDTSRPGRRRWCSMDGCGNREKTKQYRQRKAAV